MAAVHSLNPGNPPGSAQPKAETARERHRQAAATTGGHCPPVSRKSEGSSRVLLSLAQCEEVY